MIFLCFIIRNFYNEQNTLIFICVRRQIYLLTRVCCSIKLYWHEINSIGKRLTSKASKISFSNWNMFSIYGMNLLSFDVDYIPQARIALYKGESIFEQMTILYLFKVQLIIEDSMIDNYDWLSLYIFNPMVVVWWISILFCILQGQMLHPNLCILHTSKVSLGNWGWQLMWGASTYLDFQSKKTVTFKNEILTTISFSHVRYFNFLSTPTFITWFLRSTNMLKCW